MEHSSRTTMISYSIQEMVVIMYVYFSVSTGSHALHYSCLLGLYYMHSSGLVQTGPQSQPSGMAELCSGVSPTVVPSSNLQHYTHLSEGW